MIIGKMGVGKTTVGKLVASSLGREFHDSDLAIESATGKNAREIAEISGVPALHALEKGALLDSLREPPGVVAAAASVVDDREVVALLEDVVCVWIDRDPPAQPGAAHRRRLRPREDLRRRRPVYERLADLTLTGPGDARAYAQRFLEWWGDPEARLV